MRIVFFGTSSFAVPSLERLAASSHQVVACITQPDRPQGRGLRPEASPVKQAALQLKLPLLQPERPTAELIAPFTPDLGVLASYGQLVRDEVLRVPPQGILGVHPSLLPKYRGAAPVAWAIMHGETTTGVTIYRLTAKLDAGDILRQRSAPLPPDQSCETVTGRMAHLGADELLATIDALANGRVTAQPQDESAASYAPKLTKADGHIDWTTSAASIARLIRATQPWPGAATVLKGQSLKLLHGSTVEERGIMQNSAPGTIVHVDPDSFEVATGEGRVRITDVQPAGKRRMSVKQILAGHPLVIGQKLGE